MVTTRDRKMATIKLITLSLIIILLTQQVESNPKLNVPRVRLPYFESGLSVNFTLAVDPPGCYKWTTSTPSTLTLINLLNHLDGTDCTHSVQISPHQQHHQSIPSHTIVTAVDVQTGDTLRCDVVLDRITNLSIVTTTKQLHLEEAPSKLSIRGYGVQGNEFSTLEGVPFKWWFEEDTIARLIPFSESDYEASDTIKELELKRMQGHSVLIEGVKTGRGVISARITDGGYKNLPPAQLAITVVANLLLDPSEVVILPETLLPLKLLQLRQGRLTEIRLPSELYSFQVSNQSVIEYSADSVITALEVGESKVSLHDVNSELELSVYPTASVQVRDPKFLSITVQPYRNLNLVLGGEYEVVIDLYDGENQRFWVGEQVSISTELDPDYFSIIGSTKNGTTHLIKPIRTGATKIQSHLKSTTNRDGLIIELNGPRASIEIGIYDPVIIEPTIVILPCHHTKITRHTVQLVGLGGNGVYIWGTSNQSIAVVQSGVVKTERCGVVSITAAMSSNPHVRGRGEVLILPPTAMKIPSGRLEGEVGSVILIPLLIYTKLPDSGITAVYTDCRMVPLRVEIQHQEFQQGEVESTTTNTGGGCTHLAVVGSVLGESLVTIKYQDGSVNYEESVVVATFEPLRVVDPPSQLTVLALGSSRQIVFSGGPRMSNVGQDSYSRKLVVENGTVAQYKELSPADSDIYVYAVECKEIGETSVTLLIERGSQFEPLRRSTSVKVLCPHPATLNFQLENTRCPTTIPNYETTNFAVVVQDISGNSFDNITTLLITWECSTNLLTFKDDQQVLTSGVQMGGWSSTGGSWQTVIPRGESGGSLIRGSIVGYQPGVAKRASVEVITHTIQLSAVGDVVIGKYEVVMFNHPSHQVSVTLLEGSGHYSINSTDSIATAQYYEGNKTLVITPRGEGDGRITIQDLCLTKEGGPSAEIKIRVNGVGTLQLTTLSKLELGSSTNASISVLGSSGSFLSKTDLSLIKLTPTYNKDLIQIRQIESSSEFELLFSITGVNLGTSNLLFETESDVGSLTRSVSKSITVFKPLAINPSDLSLIAGAVYQLMAEGGPQVDATTNYTVDSPHIASLLMTTPGLVRALDVGHTLVTANSVDRTSSLIYSEKSSSIRVIQLERVRIHCPTTKLLQGRRMPLWVQAGDETLIGPDMLMGAENPVLVTRWGTSNEKSGSINYEFSQDDRQLRVQFEAIRPGRVTIKLIVEYQGEVYVDEVEVEVLQQLTLLSSSKPTGVQQILLTPNSEYSISTNLDSSHQIHYSVESSYEASCLETSNRCKGAKQIVSVDDSGVIRSHYAGEAVVLLLVRDQVGGLVETERVVVEVSPPHFIMSSIVKQISIPNLIPIGVTFQVVTSHHDKYGRTFDSDSQILQLRANRNDLARIEGGLDSFTIQTIGEGAVGVRISSGVMRDYVTLEMAQQVHPVLRRATLGDLICFKCGVKSAIKEPGYWTSSSDSILINRETGLGSFIKPGRGSVEYNVDNILISSDQIEIVNLEGIQFTPSSELHITNGDPTATYKFGLSLGGKSLVGSCAVGVDEVEPPFTCELLYETSTGGQRVADLFETEAGFDIEGEHYTCLIRPKPNQNPHTSINSTLVLKARLKDKQRFVEAVKKLVFYPAIHVHTEELLFSNRESTAKVIVTGLPEVLEEVELLPSNPTYLARDGRHTITKTSHLLVSSEHFKQDNYDGGQTRTYNIKLLDPFWTSERLDQSLTLSLSSPLTRQEVEIPVRVKLINFSSSSDTSGRTLVEFLTSTWSQIWSAVLVVLTTLFFMHMAAKHMFFTGGDPDSQQESVFVSRTPPPTLRSQHSPTSVLHNKGGYSPNTTSRTSSGGGGGGGDTGYSSRRLYSTQDGGGLFSPYSRKS